jgi:hypothetical protein
VGGSIVSCTIGLTATINISFKMLKLLQNVMDLLSILLGTKQQDANCVLHWHMQTLPSCSLLLIHQSFTVSPWMYFHLCPLKRYSLPYGIFQENQKFSTALRAELLHLTSPKPVNICTKSMALTQPIVRKLTVT